MTTTFRSDRGLKRLFSLATLLCAIGLLLGCSSCGDDAPDPSTLAPAEDLSPVPEPDGVVAEVLLPHPERTWKRLRALTGGPVNLLPASYPVLVTTLLGLPATVAGAFDSDVPTVGAVVAPAPGKTSAVVAVHVKSGRELVAALSTGAQAKFSAKRDAASGVTVLEPKAGGNAQWALGVVGNHLIAAPEAELVTRFGPFTARTLPTRAMPAEGLSASVSKKALGGAVAGSVRAQWKRYAGELEAADRQNRQLHGGRAPDFGDPMVALAGIGAAVEKLAGVLETSKHAKLALIAHDDRVEGRVELEPEPGGKAAATLSEMAIGDLAPLLALPRAMDLAIVNRTTAEGRAESARSLVDGATRLFGDRLSADDRKRLEQVTGDLAAGRGDVASYGLHSRDGKTSLVYRGPVADEKRFVAGIKGAIDLLKLRAVSEPVKQFVGEIATKQGTREIEGVGKVNRLALTLKPSAMRTPQGGAAVTIGPREFELVWLVKDGIGLAAISSDPSLAIVDLVTAQGDGTLSSDPPVAASVSRVGSSASFTLYAQPLRVGLGHSMKSSAPIVLALGKTGNTGFVKIDADGAAMKALVQRFARF